MLSGTGHRARAVVPSCVVHLARLSRTTVEASGYALLCVARRDDDDGNLAENGLVCTSPVLTQPPPEPLLNLNCCANDPELRRSEGASAHTHTPRATRNGVRRVLEGGLVGGRLLDALARAMTRDCAASDTQRGALHGVLE